MTETIRLGLLRLTDAAPLVAAQELGLFHALGLSVDLSVEPSWANLADKLAVGLLEGAVMLPPLAIAATLGLRGPAVALLVPGGISLGGNTITLAPALADPALDGNPAPLAVGARLRAAIARQGRRPVLAVVHGYSTHHLLLRYWLAASGIDPERDVMLTVLPPAAMVAAVEAGRIDGFCAGAPWGGMAAQAGTGRIVLGTADIWRNHPEKCLAVRADWAATAPERLHALLRGLLRAGRLCDDPAEADGLARLLARPDYLSVPAEMVRASLPSAGTQDDPLRSVFAAHAATFPWRSHARWFAGQMARWGMMAEDDATRSRVAAIYRPDLHEAAARAEDWSVPWMNQKVEGGHPSEWMLPASPAPIPMRADAFCDGALFDEKTGNMVSFAQIR